MNQETLFNSQLEVLKKDLSVLPDKSEENVENTLRALWQAASGNPASALAAQVLPIPMLSTSQVSTLQSLVRDRLAGVPLAHLTGRQSFLGLEYIVDKGLYIPRKETELLARTAIDAIAEDCVPNAEVTVVDLCTGIGTVALAVAHYCGSARVFGSDIFEPAIVAAMANARHLGLEQRATFFNADLFDPFESLSLKGTIDIVVSAPPYISSAKVKDLVPEIKEHEPKEAFDAGPFGLTIFNKIVSAAPEYLRAGGCLIFECGLGQGEFLAKRILANKHYKSVAEVRDENGQVRVLKARCHDTGSAKRIVSN